MISSLIESCVNCKKLRRATLRKHMANLPPDRTETSPLFTNVGFDVFGPWKILMRRLRGGAANAKRWVDLIFTCLSSRAIHIEVLEPMDANSFICALQRFSPSVDRWRNPDVIVALTLLDEITVGTSTFGDGPNTSPDVCSRTRLRVDI